MSFALECGQYLFSTHFNMESDNFPNEQQFSLESFRFLK